MATLLRSSSGAIHAKQKIRSRTQCNAFADTITRPCAKPTSTRSYASLNAMFDEACAGLRPPARLRIWARCSPARRARCLAAARSPHGCRRSRAFSPADRVALMMPNVMQYPVALFGTLRARHGGGERQSALHRRELEHHLRLGAKAIVIVEILRAHPAAGATAYGSQAGPGDAHR